MQDTRGVSCDAAHRPASCAPSAQELTWYQQNSWERRDLPYMVCKKLQRKRSASTVRTKFKHELIITSFTDIGEIKILTLSKLLRRLFFFFLNNFAGTG